ncbi:MAG: IclR family transcriptional regulator, partial [Caldilineae bacterium]
MADAPSAPPKYHAPALDRGFDILEALARSSTPMTLTQLAHAVGSSTNKIYRVLNSLEHRGYVRRDETTATYRLSLKLYELAHQHPPVQALINAAHRPMETLAESLGESCHLSVLRRGKLVVLQQAL